MARVGGGWHYVQREQMGEGGERSGDSGNVVTLGAGGRQHDKSGREDHAR
jgi:hypothetical protein